MKQTAGDCHVGITAADAIAISKEVVQHEIDRYKYEASAVAEERFKKIAEILLDVELGELRKTIYKMVGNELVTTGGKTYRRYEIKDGRKEKK